MSLDCLKDIVGLSNTACACWDDSKPIDFATLNTSTSGLYVSDASTIPLRWANSAADCENGGLWDLVSQALYGAGGEGGAIRDTLKDYLTLTQRVKSEQFDPFTKIGDSYIQVLSEPVKAGAIVAGCYIEPYEIKGGKLQIESVDIAFFSGIGGSTPVDISIYSSLDLVNPIDTATATVTANKTYATATFSSPVIIDLGTVRMDLNERFYFVYTIPLGAEPVKNSTYIEPCCSQSREIKNPYLQIMCAPSGVQSTSIANLETPIISTGTMQGLVINASLECDYYSWLCNLAQKPNLAYSTVGGQRLRLGMGLADAIRAKAVMNLVESLDKASRINEYTLVLGVEQFWRTYNKYKGEYDKGIKNLVHYMPADVSDCLVCNHNDTLVKGQIIVT